jgi:hypothetical protein
MLQAAPAGFARQPAAPRRGRGHQAAERAFRHLHARRHQAQIDLQRAVSRETAQVVAQRVDAVHVGEDAVLLDHEHVGAQLEKGVQHIRWQRLPLVPLPVDLGARHDHTAFSAAPAKTFKIIVI